MKLNLLRLYKRVWKTPILTSLALLLMFGDVMIVLSMPFIMKDIINQAIPQQNLALVLEKGLLMVGIALIGIVLSISNNFLAQHISLKVTEEIRNDLFVKIQEFSINNVDRLTTGRLISSVTNDVTQVQQILMMSFRILIRAPLLLIGGLIMAYATSRQLFIVVLSAIPFIVLFIIIIMKKALPKFKEIQTNLDVLNNNLLENVSASREIKTFVSEEYENKRFTVINERHAKISIGAGKIVALANPAINIITQLSIASVIYYGAYLWSLGSATPLQGVGDIMAFYSYIHTVLFGLIMLAMMLIFVSRAEVSAKRINDVINETIDLVNKEDGIKDFTLSGEITFDQVSFGYEGEANGDASPLNMTLKDINVKIKAKDVVGVIGSTGSGKSSFVQLIPRLYDVQKGRVLLDGIDVKDYDIKELRNQISLVTQESILFSGSMQSNILQGKSDASIEEIKQAASLALADEFIESKEQLYESEVTAKGTNLSGGQRQRLSLARAFIRKPAILILDDSTSAVDAHSEVKIKENIKKLSKNMTTIIVAQKISTVKDLDKIIVINNQGMIDGYGTHDELLKSSTVYQEIYQSQYGGAIHG
jgi:ATP-binding cassette, subfamily B, multidrug efflux pump